MALFVLCRTCCSCRVSVLSFVMSAVVIALGGNFFAVCCWRSLASIIRTVVAILDMHSA